MTLTNSQKRFNDNLIKLSIENNYEQCIDEWSFIEYIKKTDYDNNCLCGKPLIHQYYFINEKTEKIICSGKSCKQKLERLKKNPNSRKNIDLSKIIRMTNGIKNIGDFNLVKYCKRNFKIIIDFHLNKITQITNIKELYDYKMYLLKEWNSFFNINNLLDEIKRIENEIIETERLENEIIETERLEKKRLEKERLEKERLEKKRIEKERVEKERIQCKKNYIFGNSGKTLLWLVNNSTLIEIQSLLNNGGITEEQYNIILDKR